jgi:hypothetical protein
MPGGGCRRAFRRAARCGGWLPVPTWPWSRPSRARLAARYAATAALPTGEQRPILGLAADEAGEPMSGQPGGNREGAAVGLVALMVDGKTVRGAEDADGHHVHLLAAATHEHALVLAQTEVGAKTNEIPMFEPLLDSLDISAR